MMRRVTLLLLLSIVSTLGCSVLLGPPKQRLERESTYFGANLRKLQSYLDTMHVDVVITGVPPATVQGIKTVTDNSAKVDSSQRETIYKGVVLTRLDPEHVEIRPNTASATALVIPNSQVTRIEAKGYRQGVLDNSWQWIPYGLLIILTVIGGIGLLAGSGNGGSGAPPPGCMVVGGILVLAGAVYTLLYAVSEIYPKDPSVFD